MKDLVWYACYGSNLTEDRFRLYIKDAPVYGEGPFLIPHPLYFAKTSGKWEGKGIAFIDADSEGTSYSYLYLIDEEIYDLVYEKEGSLYSRKVDLGIKDGYPIRTFTNKTRLTYNPPGQDYLDVIAYGLKKRHHLTEEEICTYLPAESVSTDEEHIRKILERVDSYSC